MHLRNLALVATLFAHVLVTGTLAAGITNASLRIEGAGLRVDERPITTGVGIPITIQTTFAGKQNDEAPSAGGLIAVGDLVGPGIDVPIQISTTPGYKFNVPGLDENGDYFLQNIRLMNGAEVLQAASPSIVRITVAGLLNTSLRVRQLTPEEIRARGIVVDGRNYEVYEYTFTFLVNGEEVEVPFPVIIDPRTHIITPVVRERDTGLPPANSDVQPPRWNPPEVIAFEFPGTPDAGEEEPPANDVEKEVKPRRHRIPAALVIPNSLAVLHQFFAIVLNVSNGAPEGSTATLSDVEATLRINVPTALRAVKSTPSVAFGQPVPVIDPLTGARFLFAQAKGEAEWVLEGLKPGTHVVDVDIKATLREVGQEDVHLRASPSAAIVIHDPRFNVTFSHPDTVRAGLDYSTYSFVTNMSPGPQTIRLTDGLNECTPEMSTNVCRVGGGPPPGDVTLASGEMRMFEYRLRSSVTGKVFATAGTVDDGNITAAVQLHMGVSETGIPLSPSTLVLPYYAQFINQDLVSDALRLFGLGYSLATAPMNQVTARFPRVIKSDVFFRANDVARAGQRIFLSNGSAEATSDALANLTLDLLGSGNELREWDALRRSEVSGRQTGASVISELRNAVSAGRTSPVEAVDAFASATAHRGDYVFALAHSPSGTAESRPLDISLRGASGREATIANEAESGWKREIPFADIARFDAFAHFGELAVAGRWTEDLDVIIVPHVAGAFEVELLFPGAAPGTTMRAHLAGNGTPGEPLRIPLTRGAATVSLVMSNGGFAATSSATTVTPAPLTIMGARQDLHLDGEGHQVSVLFSRPVTLQEGEDLRAKFSAEIDFAADGVTFRAPRPIFAAALQPDGRVVNLAFDNVLSTNASYEIATAALIDPLTSGEISFPTVQPKIDNDRPAGILYGKFITGDNQPIPDSEIKFFTGHWRGCSLTDREDPIACNPYREAPQYALTREDGSFLFEYVPRDVIADPALTGGYKVVGVTSAGRYSVVEGAVRLPGRVHFVNLQLLGRGSATGTVRYDDGSIATGVRVHVSSTMFNAGRSTQTDENGRFAVDDLPVGPVTFSAVDEEGNTVFASGEIATPGQVATKDLVIYRKPFPGTGAVYGVVRRSDDGAPVAGARVAVHSQGYGFDETITGSDGRFRFAKVPAGFVTLLAAEWSIARESATADFDLKADETRAIDLTLGVTPAGMPLVRVTGRVLRENPLYPGDPARYELVSGAIVKLSVLTTTTDPEGRFSFDGIPLAAGGSNVLIRAYDPSTKRVGEATLPTLSESEANEVAVFIPANSYGGGTIRVRVVNAQGQPVDGFRVIERGFPPVRLRAAGGGIYEYADAPVGHSVLIYAVQGPPAYNDQYASGKIKLDFHGQVATLILRLPGQGTVRAKLRGDFDLIGPVNLTYGVWDEAEQKVLPRTREGSTDENGIAGYATFGGVPALQTYSVSSAHPVYGQVHQTGTLAYEGDLLSHILQLNKLATVSGTVYAIDGVTPVVGAAVRMYDGVRDAGNVYTQPDGKFVFHDVPADIDFQLVAEATQSGVYRTAVSYGRTPSLGGPAPDASMILQRRGVVAGKVVYADYLVFDPENPANHVSDPTPHDLSDNAPVPLARMWLRELDFPGRSFGTAAQPLIADAGGRFALSNVFIGSLRAKAWVVDNQEIVGDWTGVLSQEGEELTNVYIGIGTNGTGSLQVNVVDPNQQFLAIPNAEVRLFRNGGLFDLTTTDGAGIARFDELPVGTYATDAYSKSLGKSGAGVGVEVTRDEVAQTRVLLEFVGKVDGLLTDPMSSPADAPVPGVSVRLNASSFYAFASTDGGGSFSFEGVREGTFDLSAKDRDSNRWAYARGEITPANRRPFISMALERTETLFAEVYLPDDTGANSGRLAGAFAMEARQRCFGADCDFRRALQGNPLSFPGLVAADRWGNPESYWIVAKELGGAARELTYTGKFPKGTASDPVQLVYPAFGDVSVTVTQGDLPVSGARVQISGGGSQANLITDASGRVSASGFQLDKSITIQATSLDGRFSGSTSTTIDRTSVPAAVTIKLGAYAGVTGLVEAEGGGPSIGTRVTATFSSHTFETLTDGSGAYTFQGITADASTTVSLAYAGPDGITIGARQQRAMSTADAMKIVTLPSVRLDATPPQIVSIVPLDGAQDVSPDSHIRIVFSEPVQASDLTPKNLELVAADGSGGVDALLESETRSDGTFAVTLRPRLLAGERFPLRSNTLYRVIVKAGIRDLTGHHLPAPRGSAFSTSDYVEPRVVKLDPSDELPLPKQGALQYHFNEPIDAQPWAAGGGAAFRFYKLAAPGGPGAAVVAEKTGRAYVDPVNALYLAFAPDEEIEPESFYRAVFTGIRDLQGNELTPQTYHYFSFDDVKPWLRLVSPVPEGAGLVSGVQYELTVEAPPDVAAVEYLRIDGATETWLTTTTSPPFSYRFVAPDAPESGLAYTLRAKATDSSGNEGDPASITWTVRSNAAPKELAITLDPPAAYPASRVTAAVTFVDEGILATVQVTLRATRKDGSPHVASQTKEIRRSSVGEGWPAASYTFDLPPTLQPDSAASFTATVTDVRGLAASADASVVLLRDDSPPTIVSTSPAPETTYALNARYRVEAVVADTETGVAEVKFVVDGVTYRVTADGSMAGPESGSRSFATPEITVPARNVDTRVPVVVTAIDHQANATSRSFEILYTGVNDPTAPKVTWLCPIDRAVVPAAMSAFAVPLRVRAQDDVSITSVKFRVPGLTEPVVATRVGASDEFATVVSVATPAAGEEFVVTAIVSDADPAHTIELPIAIDVVAFDRVIDATEAVDFDTVASYEDKSLLVSGSSGKLVVNVPLRVRNLAVIAGGVVETLPTTTTKERRVDLTVLDRLFIDCTSRIDVSRQGYVGGWGANADGSGTINESPVGRTVGNALAGGATDAGASHAGLGGSGSAGSANPPYGDLQRPDALGSGGAGAATRGHAGGSGGGAVTIRSAGSADTIGRVVIAGSIRADGGGREHSGRNGGSGGSIRVTARQLLAGPLSQITSNGGNGMDCGSTTPCFGGGGGRIALSAEERFEVPLSVVRAFGGRNGSAATPLHAGAGTIHVRRPGQEHGELHVAADPAAAAPFFTRPTPVAAPTLLELDRVAVGPHALVRFDSSTSVAGAVDSRAAIEVDAAGAVVLAGELPTLSIVTTPPVASELIKDTALAISLSASSHAGLSGAEITLSAAAGRTEPFVAFPSSVDQHPITLEITPGATVGAATLAVRVADRAERAAEVEVGTFTIVENQPPEITAFEVTPGGVFPGQSFTARVSASDDVSVKTLTFASRVGSDAASTTTRRPESKVVAGEIFTVPIPITTPGGTTVSLEAAVSDGYAGRIATSSSRMVDVLTDTVSPEVSIVEPAAGQLFQEGSGRTFTVRVTAVDAEVAVRAVSVRIAGAAPVSLTPDGAPGGWKAVVAVPNVDGNVEVRVPVVVTAIDYEGNTGIADLEIRVEPIVDPTAPDIRWTCGGIGAMYPPGHAATFRVYAKGVTLPEGTVNGVHKVEFYIDGDATPVTALAGANDQFEAKITIPAAPDGTEVVIRAVATSVSGSTSDLATRIRVIESELPPITSDLRIDTSNAAAYAGRTLIVSGGTLTIAVPLALERLSIIGGTVTHPAGGAHTLDLDVTGDVFIACGAGMDASERGYQDASGSSGRTWPDALTGGSTGWSGGSHGGSGAKVRAADTVAATYGSLFDPATPGGAGGSEATAVCSPCNMGGGVVRLRAANVAVDGRIAANGGGTNATGGAGAGGSVRIDAVSLHGAGDIRAEGGPSVWNGGNGWHGAGGGGRIAIYAQSQDLAHAGISAAGGTNGSEADKRGAPGTVYIRLVDAASVSLSDELIVSSPKAAAVATRLPSVGLRTADEVAADSLRDTGASLPGPDHLKGISVTTLPDKTNRWLITGNTSDTVRVDVSARPLSIAAGTPFRGIQRFEKLTLLNAKLELEDLLEFGTLDSASSSIGGSNESAPLVDPDKVSIQLAATGSSLVGSAGAVSDPDQPVRLVATNVRSSQTFSANVALDGSFIVPVYGDAGDAITYFARDTNAFPLESPMFAAGTIAETTPVPTQLSSTAWTTESGFRPQLIGVDGELLVTAASALTGASSDKLAILDITDPTRPIHVRTVRVANGAIRDVIVVGGWAYIVGDDFFTFELRNTTRGFVSAPSRSGYENAIAVAGGYAYTASEYNTDGEIHVYDVSTPSAPRHVASKRTAGAANTLYEDLLAYGNDYLVGISRGASGRDVTIIDRRDVNNLAGIAHLEIDGFSARRGRIQGTRLYLTGPADAELVIVELANPSAPVVIGRVALPAAAGDVAGAGETLFVAGTTAGLVAVSTPSMQLAGVAPTGGIARDVVVAAGHAYVANEVGISLMAVSAAPVIDSSRLQLALAGATVTVSGAPGSITGTGALAVMVTNAASDATGGATVGTDGSFSAALEGAAGDLITLTATDDSGRANGPVVIGTVPFGGSTRVIPVALSNDAGFRARTIRTEATRVVVGSYPAYGTGSDKLVVFDASDAFAPLQTRIAQVPGHVRDFELRDGWLYVVGNDFFTLDLTNPTSTLVSAPSRAGYENAVAVTGGYAFTSSEYNTDGEVHVYDVSKPGLPRLISTQRTAGIAGNVYDDLIAYGTDYLIGLTVGASGRDVTVIDRRDVNRLVSVASLTIPEITAFRGRISGSTLYVAGQEGGVAAVDLSVPSAPRVLSILDTPGLAHGVEVAGDTVIVADRAPGVAFLENSSGSLRQTGTHATGGDAWDVALGASVLYVANEQGLVVIGDVVAPPRIDSALVFVTPDGRVTGASRAVTGAGALVAAVTNTATEATMTVNVASDGSFTAALPVSSGDAMTLTVTDSRGRVAGPVSLGTVPFSESTRVIPVTVANDPSFRARTVKVEAARAVVGSYPAYGTGSNKLVVFDVSNAAVPAQTRVVQVAGQVRDFEIADGWLFVASDDFFTLDLKAATSAVISAPARAGYENAVAVRGGYAFTSAEYNTDGEIHIYDVSNPAAPRFVRTQRTAGVSDNVYSDLLPYGTDYLIGLSGGTSGRDLTVLDRRDINNLVRVSTLSIPGISAFRGRISGSILYIAGQEGGVAMIDLSSPAAPAVVSSYDTPGLAQGLDVAGTTVMTADRSAGVTFLDSAGGVLRKLGVHITGGDAWDAALAGSTLYVANEQGLVVVDGVVAPPTVDLSRIRVTDAAVVVGSAGAISGASVLTVQAANSGNGSTVSVNVAGDGSFTAPLTGGAGDVVTLRATDGNGRSAGPYVIGSIPFGSATRTIPIAISGDPNFRARIVRTEANRAVVTSAAGYDTGSDRIVVFDITDAGAPAQTRVARVSGAVRDVELRDGWLYVVGDDFFLLNLASETSAVIAAPARAGYENAVAVSGGYAFTASEYNTDGEIHLYDVSNPQTPTFIRSQRTAGSVNTVYTDLVAYGTDYLVGISNGASGQDVTILDRRDVNNLLRVATYTLPGISAFRGRIVGSTLYVAGQDGGVAMIDLSHPSAPRLVSVLDTAGIAQGIDAAGSTLMVADRSAGVTFLDAADGTLRQTGIHVTGGDAWDVSLAGSALYVANEQGLVVIENVVAPPDIEPQLISISGSTGTASVMGGAYAVGGQRPLRIEVTNARTNDTESVTADANGSFVVTVAALSGDALTLRVIDTRDRASTLQLYAPFFSVTSDQAARDADGNMWGRRVVSDGGVVVATNGAVYGARVHNTNSGRISISRSSSDVSIYSSGVGIDDVEMRGSYVLAAGDTLFTVDTGSATPVRALANSDRPGNEWAIVTIGSYAFTAEGSYNNNGTIHVYDITTPSSPSYVRSQAMAGVSGISYRDLIAYGGRYLVAVSPEASRDVTILDTANPASLVKLAEIDLPDFSAFSGAVDGNLLYLSGGDRGVAVVDLATITAPALRAILDTPGVARGIAASGPDEFVVADGASGLTFVDVGNPAAPRIKGTQSLRGTATDVKVAGTQIFVAAETRFFRLERVQN